ncbi:hypothetical protein [Buttiauxella sp.]|uniref:hypothetical protein n=1 Tax=Buttiauxella sp. TaxID=1972222 RepID=UPI003C72F15C
MNKEQIIGSANQAQQNEDSHSNSCGRTWHLGLFFDGVERNIEQDATQHRLSNVARLFRAYPENSSNTNNSCFDKFYFSGLGTPFKEELSEKLRTAMDGGLDKFIDEVKSIPAGELEEAAGEIFTKPWYEVLDNKFKELCNPLKWKKVITAVKGKILTKVSIESTPWLRDNKVMSAMFLTGVDTRVSSAKTRFEDFYEKNNNNNALPVKNISISIFGFDLGATLARKFIDDLLKDICQKEEIKGSPVKYLYNKVPVDIIFAGFFDCSRHSPASSNNGLDYYVALLGAPGEGVSLFMGEKAIDQDTPLPSMVRNALHLVAAHERRPWRGIYSLGKGKWQEILLAGSSEDIGGGLLPDEQKPSAELCRVALHQMYRTAYMAGVPFPDYQTMDKIDTDIASYFYMNDTIEGRSAQYWARRYQSSVGNQTLSIHAQNAHLDSYFDWLGRQYYLYCTELQRIDAEKADIMSTITLSTEDPETRAKIADNHLARETLKNNWSWLDDVKDQARWFINSVMTNPNDTRIRIAPKIYTPAFKRAEKFLEYSVCAYQQKPMPASTDNAPEEIFSWLVHDIQKVDPAASISVDFLAIRSFEVPEVEED